MKTVCRLEDFETPNVSIYLFDDDTDIEIGQNQTVIRSVTGEISLTILDCDTSNCVLHENVSAPYGYVGWKYTYDPVGGWQPNQNWAKIVEVSEMDPENLSFGLPEEASDGDT